MKATGEPPDASDERRSKPPIFVRTADYSILPHRQMRDRGLRTARASHGLPKKDQDQLFAAGAV